jgi:2-methylcitrate dehydratase PrpD
LVLNTTFKRYPVCAFAQTPIAAALGVKERIGRRAVKSISIALSPREVAYPGLDNAGPYFSNTETNMSVLYCVAHTLVYGPPTTDADLTKFRDPALERLLECTRLVSDDDLQPLWTGIVIELENGEVVSGLQRPSSHALTAEGAVQEMVREVLRLEPDYEQRLKAVNTFMSSLPALSPGDVTRLFAVQ